MTTSFSYRSCYVNFAAHLLNRYNPNMLYPDLEGRWSDEQWFRFIDMIDAFGFNVFEFWLVPRLFCREGLASPAGRQFADQINAVAEYAAGRGIRTKTICSLATVGADWQTYCPNVREQWDECRYLWDAWTKRLGGLGIVSIFPGDPGACSLNGCTALTFIDKAVEVADIVKKNLPNAGIELNTWGNPFFGWGCIRGPEGWNGEFVQDYQHTAWTFDKARADAAMSHLIARLKDFPKDTAVAINLGFVPDGDPDAHDGLADARPWANEIAKTNPVRTWDFSLTEGENAIVPHYRFERLFAQRRRERAAAPYEGGICFTMTPALNQLSLYMSSASFMDPDADYDVLVGDFYENLFGPDARQLVDLLPLFEIVPDWGNHVKVDLSRPDFHAAMQRGVTLMHDLQGDINTGAAIAPSPREYHATLLWYFDFFAELSAESPDFDALYKKYWRQVYSIYDHLPQHVDPRPKLATGTIVNVFKKQAKPSGPIAGKWTD